MMVFIYIAHFTTSPDMMVSILYDLHAETDLVKKAKDWLSHIASNFCLVTQPPSWLSLLCLRHNCKISDNAPITSPSQEIQRYINNQRQPSISTSTRNHVIPDQLQCPIATHVGTSKNSTRNGMTIRRTRSGAAIRGNSTTNIHNECWNSPKWLHQERTIAPTTDRHLCLPRTYRAKAQPVICRSQAINRAQDCHQHPTIKIVS